MEISLKKDNSNNATLSITMAQDEYVGKVDKALKDYRKRANVPGFRVGHAPLSIIRKQYEESVRADEVNRMLQDKLFTYLQDEKLDILGQPLPVQDQVDFSESSHVFEFELGLSPEFDLNISEKVRLPRISIQIESKDIDTEVMNLRKRFGQMSEVDVAGPEDVFFGSFQAVDKKGVPVEGFESKDGRFTNDVVDSRYLRKPLAKIQTGESCEVYANKYFKKDFDLEAILKLSPEEKAQSTGIYTFTLKNIYHITPAEMDQEFFDKVFGEGKVKEEADMQEQIREELAKVYDRDVDTHFFNTATEHLMKTKMALPVAFLKKWMTQSGENAMSTEEMEENWTNSEKGMRWQLIENKLVKDHHLHVHKEELVAFTVKMITVRMAEFGQANMGPEELEKMAANLLEDRNQAEQLSEQLLHDKMMTFFKSNFGIKESKSSIADFRKLVQKNQ